MKVIDSSSLSKYVNREAHWERVKAVLAEGCVTLELAAKEVGNSLWRRVTKGEVPPDLAVSAYTDFVTLRPFKTASQEQLYSTALETATTFGITLYDALFITLARDLHLPFVTSDEKQADVSRKLRIDTIYIP